MPRRIAPLLLLALLAPVTVLADEPAASGDDFFEVTIRPLLVERCLDCHGEKDIKGGLTLTSREAILKGGDSGPAAVAGTPAESLILDAVRYEFEPRMPPGGKLSDAEIAALTRWVEMGLPWPASSPSAKPAPAEVPAFAITDEQRQFWAFRPIGNPEPPAVRDGTWPRNPIDRYLLARLEAEGLRPAPEADRRTLIRRLSVDLTGLPPSPAEVEAFVADPAPDAYERLVDRLLASPAYGERWGRYWLDVVRYADSLDTRGSGQPGDILDAWRYRDWVVNALNADLPYDRFVGLQVAGDVLPPVESADGSEDFNRAGTVATTMLAIGNWGNGDADKDKILTDIADDQVDVVSKAFLGLTVSCARCHDHKFDPISQADYYALAGIFFSTHILPELTPKGAGETIIRVPLASPAELARREQHGKDVAAMEARIAEETRRRAVEVARARKPEAARYLMAVYDHQRGGDSAARPSIAEHAAADGLDPAALERWSARLGLGTYRPMTNASSEILGASGVLGWNGPGGTPSATANTRPEVIPLLTFRLPARSVSVHPGPTTGVVVAWTSPIAGRVRVAGSVSDGDPAGGDGIAWAIDHRAALGAAELASGDVPNGGSQAFANVEGAGRLATVDVRPGDRIELLVLPKEAHTCDTTAVELVVSAWDSPDTWDLTRDVLDSFHAGNPHADRLGHPAVWSFEDMAGTPRASAEAGPELDRWREAITSGDRAAIEQAAGPLAAKLATEDESSPFWPTSPAAFPPADRQALDALNRELGALRAATPAPLEYANAAQEGGVPKSPHAGVHDVAIHIRGHYDRLGPVVPRRFPEILEVSDPPTIAEGSGRRELADWLTRPDHPLTARVIANRLWQHHFGTGIVATPSNFGKLGARPTHPELLDHLARRLIDDGWSLKALHRAIVTSAAYRQSSIPWTETLERDPDNHLLGAMPRRRLEAEVLRDALLAASGRLDRKLGGPADRDAKTARRGLYVVTIRSDRATFGALFDQADSTAPVDRRTSSTVAPQALYLMNHPFAIEQAGGLAARLMAEGADDRDRIERAYRLLYARTATADEMAVGLDLLGSARQSGESDEAAWRLYAQVLLCANEFLYVD